MKGYGLADIIAVAAELDSATGTTRAGPQRRRIWAARIERAVEEIEPRLDALAKIRSLHAPVPVREGRGLPSTFLVCPACLDVEGEWAEWPCATAVIAGVEEEE